VLDRHRVQEVIIADPDFPEEQAVDLVDQCHRRGVTVRIAPSTMEILVHRAEFVPGASVPLFELRPPVFDGFDYLVKRSFDFIGALLLIVLLSPLLIAIALAVFITSRGPVLYRSIRPGIGGEPFACFKFRTMRSDADQLQADLESYNEASGALFKIRRDPRMTRIGRFLRLYSLDELPQLFNVVRGEMSLVGPRPIVPLEATHYGERLTTLLSVRPGITGPWAVQGRSRVGYPERADMELTYATNWTFVNDARILARTPWAVVTQRGAL
jgi:exopolysaccharide biosynthesis polyprenyl glycosylphosphotransferase